MSYNEFLNATDVYPVSEAPVIGNTSSTKKDKSSIRVRYVVACASDAADISFIEDIMTRSVKCANQLVEVGDVAIFREDSTFDKTGEYHVALKYGEMVKDTDELQEVKK